LKTLVGTNVSNVRDKTVAHRSFWCLTNSNIGRLQEHKQNKYTLKCRGTKALQIVTRVSSNKRTIQKFYLLNHISKTVESVLKKATV